HAVVASLVRVPPRSTLSPYTTLFRSIISTLPSAGLGALLALQLFGSELTVIAFIGIILLIGIVKKNGIMLVDFALEGERRGGLSDRKSTRLNSSHVSISYAVFCLKKK